MDALLPSPLFDHLPLAACRISPAGRLLRANPILVRLLGGANEAALLAWAARLAQPWHADPHLCARYLALMPDSGQVLGFDSRLHRRDGGKPVAVRETAVALRDAQGAVGCFEGVVEPLAVARRLAGRASGAGGGLSGVHPRA